MFDGFFSAASLPHLFTESWEEPRKRVKPKPNNVHLADASDS